MQELEFEVRVWALVRKNGSVEVEAEVRSKSCDFVTKEGWTYTNVKEFAEGSEYVRQAEVVISEFVEEQRQWLKELIENKRRVEQELQAIAKKLGGEVVEVRGEWER